MQFAVHHSLKLVHFPHGNTRVSQSLMAPHGALNSQMWRWWHTQAQHTARWACHCPGAESRQRHPLWGVGSSESQWWPWRVEWWHQPQQQGLGESPWPQRHCCWSLRCGVRYSGSSSGSSSSSRNSSNSSSSNWGLSQVTPWELLDQDTFYLPVWSMGEGLWYSTASADQSETTWTTLMLSGSHL